MNQLIKITTVPIQYELKVNNARFERRSSQAELEIRRNKGGLSIKSRPVKLNLDSSLCEKLCCSNNNSGCFSGRTERKECALQCNRTISSGRTALIES